MDPNKNKKLYLIMGCIVIVFLIILTNLIRSDNEAIIDYGDVESVSDILVNATLDTDRETYYTLDAIISKFVSSYSVNEENDEGYEEYYNVLHKSYRDELGKSKYKEIAKNFFDKLTITQETGMSTLSYVQSERILRQIYAIDTNTYLCVVGAENSSKVGYIGIKLNNETNTYSIFYLE
ncbi:MAG: hypothetical protein IKV94_05820 [Clostridia bacterium]|nr:hypothetical protein [Clostridia bacterium]